MDINCLDLFWRYFDVISTDLLFIFEFIKRSFMNCCFHNFSIYLIAQITKCLSYFANYSLLVIATFVFKSLVNKCFYLWQCCLFKSKNFRKCKDFCYLDKLCKLFIFYWIIIWFRYSFLWLSNIKKNFYFLICEIIKLKELIFILNYAFLCNSFIKWIWEDSFNNCSILLCF